jgi:hypothetical protein
MNEFSVLFELSKSERGISVYVLERIELPRKDGPHIADVINDFDLERNIECFEQVENLPNGEYGCLLSGSWEYEITYDSEGNKDAELMIDIKILAVQSSEQDAQPLDRTGEQS